MKNVLPIVLLSCKDPEKVAFFEKALKGSFSLIHVEEMKEAFEWLKASPIEILILERHSSDASLEEICPAVLKASGKKKFPILLISKLIKKPAVLKALNAGITDFIHEPLDALEIHERIAVYLHSKCANKKMNLMRTKIKATPFLPQNSKIFSQKTILRDETLKIMQAAKKGALPLSLLMIHLDSSPHFKKNSKEEILNSLENLLKGRLRKYDTLTIEGPGQYLILLPKTSPSAARAIAADIQKEVSSTPIKDILITVSIGVISFEKELSQSTKDFEKFDLCLEKIKKSLTKAHKKGTVII